MKLKKLLTTLSITSLALISFASCDNEKNEKVEETSSIVDGSSNEKNSSSEDEMKSSEELSSSENESKTSAQDTYSYESLENSIYDMEDGFTKTEQTVYMVGDSTMCEYSTLDSYYYPRYGYGTQLNNYLDSNITVNNLALSGRSSLSFTKENNYTTLKDSISSGDYLIIGFGHNDEKTNQDVFRNANYKDIDAALSDVSSFQYSLYNNYIKLAQDKGAYPIIATPIVRYDNTFAYNGSKVHSTSTGDYKQAAIDVAKKFDIPYVNLTDITRKDYKELESDALYYHAIFEGTDESEGEDPDMNKYDGTHINYYGANKICYEFVNALKYTKSTLRHYIKDDITEPTKDILTKYSKYTWVPYTVPNLDTYNPSSSFETCYLDTGWAGTAFGTTTTGTAKIIDEDNQIFNVSSTAGKFESAGDSFAFLFRQLDFDQNFTLSATITLKSDITTKQTAFGIMVRDDCVINQKSTVTTGRTTNFAGGGFFANDDVNSGKLFLDRYNNSLSKKTDINSVPAKGDTMDLTLQLNGQYVYVTIVYKGTTYKKTYTDYTFTAKDQDHIYCGFYANRGASIDVSNIVYTEQGKNTGA